MPKPKLYLFWCWTLEHDEDWFVIANNSEEAAQFHCDAEGFDNVGEVLTERLVCLPDHLQGVVEIGWPSEEVVEACGGVFLHKETPRVVHICHETFVEGFMEFLVCQGDLNPPKP
jgi:hypothetical protein